MEREGSAMTLRRRAHSHTATAEPAPSPEPGRPRRDRVRTALTTALELDLVEITGNPIVDVASGAVRGVDAVLRFPQGPVDLLVGDGSVRSLLSAASDDDVRLLNARLVAAIVDLGRRAMVSRDPRVGPPTVSITLDERFVADDGFLDGVKRAVRSSGIEPSQLLLSLDVGPAFDEIWPSVQRLKSHGVQVAVDRFTPTGPAADAASRYRFEVARVVLPSLGPAPYGPGGDGGSDGIDREIIDAVKVAHRLDCAVLLDVGAVEPSPSVLAEIGADYLVAASTADRCEAR